MKDEDNVLLPLFQRVFAKTLSLDLVEVKPIGPPSGMLHYMDFQYGEPDRGVLGEIYKKYKASNKEKSYLSYEEFLDELGKGNEEFIKTIII